MLYLYNQFAYKNFMFLFITSNYLESYGNAAHKCIFINFNYNTNIAQFVYLHYVVNE